MMRAKVLEVSIGILLMICWSVADPLDDFYPKITNCFQGFHSQENIRSTVTRNNIVQLTCAQDYEGIPMCYKFCLLERNELLSANISESGGRTYRVDPVRLAGRVKNLLGISDLTPPYDEIQSEEKRVAELLSKCQDLSINVPEGDGSGCEDLESKYEEGVKLMKCIEDTLEKC